MTAKEKRIYAQYMREVAEALDRWADEPYDYRGRHAHWIKSSVAPGYKKCSACRIVKYTAATNYCPNCGAKMDGGDHDAAD